jgi:hypothetical protein
MPYAWTQRQDMSADGYADPDGQGECFIGFDGLSPMINYTATFSPAAGNGPCKYFIQSFYKFALQEGRSVHYALDHASDEYFGCYFSSTNCIFRQGYNTWWPGWPNPPEGFEEWEEEGYKGPYHMKVFGDTTCT